MITDRSRRRRWGSTVAATLCALALGGCTDDSGETSTSAEPTRSSSTIAVDPSSPEPDGGTAPGSGADDALLTEDDLPDGWALTDATDSEDGLDPFASDPMDEPSTPGCGVLDELEPSARVRFEEGPRHVLVQVVVTAADATEAEAMFGCMKADLGETPEGPVEPELVDGVGDEAYVASTGAPLPVTLGGVRRGATVSALLAFGFDGSDDAALVTDLLEVTADRLPG